MKNQNIIRQLLLVITILLAMNTYAQFQITPSTNNEFMRTDQIIRGVGIGNFPTGQITDAALHVNTNYLTTSSNYPSIDFGEVFRTDAPNASGNHEYWRMYHGGSEKFNIINYSGSNDAYLGTVLSGSLNFNTYSALRMTILGDAVGNGLAGYVGIGTAAPDFKLHLYSDGGILSTGNTLGTGASLPALAPTPRLIWYPAKAAFRVGTTTPVTSPWTSNTCWDDANIGISSFAAGDGTLAKGTSSTALGNNAKAWGDYSFAVGKNVGANADYSIAIGTEAVASGYGSSAFGTYISATGNYSQVIGVGDGLFTLDNPDAYSLRIGYLSELPTLYVSTSFGLGTTGSVGIATTNTSNKLVVNAEVADLSGLTFQQLTSSSATQTPNGKALTVSSTGEVILVDDGGGDVSSCSGGVTQDFITKWSATAPATVCKSIIYEDVASRVGIGTGATTLLGKLHINNTIERIGHLVITNRLTATTPNFGTSTNCTGSDIANVGVIATARFSSATVSNNLINVGVFGNARGLSLQNIGGLFVANDKTTCGINYGVWGIADHNCNNSHDGLAGFFTGNVEYTGTLNGVSDAKLKDSIQNINGALAILSKLLPKQFAFRTDSFPSMNLSTGTHYGLIAQEIDTVLPQLVANIIQPQLIDSNGTVVYDSIHFKGVNYMELIPFTIRAIQELDSLQNTKLTSCTGTAPPAANNLTKWDSASNVLCTSIIYDDGTRIGIPVVDANSYVNVVNHRYAAAASFMSDDSVNTAAVIKALYDANGNTNVVSAVSGYSKYVNNRSYYDGIGGSFEGGLNGVYGLASGAIDEPAGITGQCKNATDINKGVVGLAINYTSVINAGVFGIADSADEISAGVVGITGGSHPTAHKAGVIGFASGSANENFGGRFETDDTVGTNYAVFGIANGSAPDAYAGYFDGDVHATGTVTWTSDQNLKTNVQDINSNDALATVLKLAPKTYNYRTADYPYMNLAHGNQYGLLAQDVEQVLPDLVSDIIQPERKDLHGNVQSPKLEYKGLNYVGIIPLLIGAAKEEHAKVDSLTNVINTVTERLTALEERLNICCRPQGSRKTDDTEGDRTPPANENAVQVNHMSIELSSMQVIVLEQNVPNPFAEQTSISYFVPENMTNAQIIFTDMLGTVIKTADIKTGYGIMTVFASNLSTGQYSYTLLVDGKTIETKKMVKSK